MKLHLIPLLLALTPGLSMASTLPDAAPEGTVLGLGLAPSISLDMPAGAGSFGFSAGAPWYRYSYRGILPYMEARYIIPLAGVRDPNLSMAILVGALASTDPDDWYWFGLPVGPELGILLAYQLSPELRARINLVGGFGPTWWWGDRSFGSPSAGLELGYQFSPTVEGTLTLGEYGSFIGARIKL